MKTLIAASLLCFGIVRSLVPAPALQPVLATSPSTRPSDVATASSGSSWARRGHDAISRKNYADAIRCYDRALGAGPPGVARLQWEKALANAHVQQARELKKRYEREAAARHYQKAYDIYQVHGARGVAVDLSNMGESCHELGRYQEALGYFERLLRARQKSSDQRGLADALTKVGVGHGWLGRNEAALKYLEQALGLWREVGHRPGEAKVLSSIGITHRNLGRPEAALKYLEQALALRREDKNGEEEALALNQIGRTLGALNKQEDALRSYQLALRVVRGLKDRRTEAQTLNNIGEAHRSLGRNEEALAAFGQALPLWRLFKDRLGTAFALTYSGEASNNLGRHQEAIKYLWPALPLLREIREPLGEALAQHNIALALAALGRHQQALRHYAPALGHFRALKVLASETSVLNDSATSLAHLGRYNEAVRRYDLAQAAGPEPRGQIAPSAATGSANPKLHGLKPESAEERARQGAAAVKARDFPRAVACYARAAQLNPAQPAYKSELAEAHFYWGRQLGERRFFAEAIEHHLRARALYRGIKESVFDVLLLRMLGLNHSSLGRHEEALTYFEQARLLLKAPDDRLSEASVLMSMGISHEKLGHLNDALRCFGEALEIFRTEVDKVPAREVHAHLGLGLIYTRQSRYEEANRHNQQALQIYRDFKELERQASTLNTIGFNLGQMNRLEEALALHRQSLEVAREARDRRGQAWATESIGSVYSRLSRFEEALEHAREALAIRREIRDRDGEGGALDDLGRLYLSLGRYQPAHKYLQQALQLRREIKDRLGQDITLTNLGHLYSRTNRPAQALRLHRQALAISRERKSRAGEGVSLGNIGGVYNKLGQFKAAMPYLRHALAIAREVENRMGEAAAMSEMGVSEAGLGRLPSAAALQQAALLGFAQEKNRRGEAMALERMMRLRGRMGQVGLAIFYGKRAVNALQEVRGYIQNLDKETQKSFVESNQNTYRALAGLMIEAGRLPEAEQVLRLLKQQEFFDFVRRDAVRTQNSQGSQDTTLTTLTPQEAEWARRYDQVAEEATSIGVRVAVLEQKKKRGRSEAEESELQTLRRDQEAINGRFTIFLRELARSLAGRGHKAREVRESQGWQARLAELERRDDQRAAVLYTLVGPDRFRVILLTAHTRQAFEFPVGEAGLNRKVAALRRALTQERTNPVPAAQEIYKILFCDGRLERALAGAKIETALWFLDGSLRYVPIAALHDGSKYLVQRERNNVVITPTSEKRGFEKPEDRGEMLGLGVSKPHQVEVQSGLAVSHVGFKALAAVPDELRGIIRDEKRGGVGPMPGQILLDPDFTAASLREALSEGFRTVHIASHFNLKAGDEAASFLLLGDGKALPMLQWQTQMNLSAVDLLTLSACDTAVSGAPKAHTGAGSGSGSGSDQDEGVGDAAGAEVDSLGEVTQRLGAASVVASLWPVADSSTSLLMRAFYRARAEHPEIGKAQALRHAQLTLLSGWSGEAQALAQVLAAASPNDPVSRSSRSDEGPAGAGPAFKTDPRAPFSHPYFWAPFILIGNWR